MISQGYHKLISFVEWTFPVGVLAQAAPGASNPLESANSQWTLIVIGVSMVATKIVESVLTGYEKYRNITDKSEHGKLAACQAEISLQKESYEREIARLRGQSQSITSDYEVRIQTKRDETEYLRTLLASSRESEKQLLLRNEAMMAQIIQQNESMAKLAHRSVDNTKEAISKITTPAFTGPGSSTSIPVVPPVTVVAVDAHQAPCDPPEETKHGDE